MDHVMHRRSVPIRALKSRLACLIVISVMLCAGYLPRTALAEVFRSTPVAVFLSDSCGECREVAAYLDRLTASGTPLDVHQYHFEDITVAPLRHSLDLLYNVPEDDWYVVPTVFIGKTVLIRADDIETRLPHLLETVTAQDNAFLLQHLAATTTTATSQLASALSVGTVLGAGLIDGINPCAFATLLFFISYIILRSGSRNRILLTGCSFAAGIFCAYFLAGLGLSCLVTSTSWFGTVARWLYGFLGLLSAILAMLSLRDAVLAHHGHTHEMSLQLPGREKSGIRSLIRRAAGSRLMPLWAFLVAFPVALLEFLCTGQTYLPTIVLIIASEGLHSHAVFLLLLYNLLFILPLLAITILAVAGVSSERLQSWFTRHLPAAKLLGALLFTLFAVLFLSRWWKGR
jgi:cytochrome c biogenesis protein CcdA